MSLLNFGGCGSNDGCGNNCILWFLIIVIILVCNCQNNDYDRSDNCGCNDNCGC